MTSGSRDASRAGDDNWFRIHPPGLAFDVGRGALQLAGAQDVFLSHGHLDHALGLPYVLSQRSLHRLVAHPGVLPGGDRRAAGRLHGRRRAAGEGPLPLRPRPALPRRPGGGGAGPHHRGVRHRPRGAEPRLPPLARAPAPGPGLRGAAAGRADRAARAGGRHRRGGRGHLAHLLRRHRAGDLHDGAADLPQPGADAGVHLPRRGAPRQGGALQAPPSGGHRRSARASFTTRRSCCITCRAGSASRSCGPRSSGACRSWRREFTSWWRERPYEQRDEHRETSSGGGP